MIDRAQPSLEPLEPRRLFAAGIRIFPGTTSLHVRGNAFIANTITVGNNANAIDVDITIAWTVNGTPKSISRSIRSAAFTFIDIHGGTKNDTVTIDQTSLPFTKNTIIDTFSGDDTVIAGDEKDKIAGGPGNDSINAG